MMIVIIMIIIKEYFSRSKAPLWNSIQTYQIELDCTWYTIGNFRNIVFVVCCIILIEL